MEDSYRHKGLRQKLVEEIEKKGILDPLILAAINAVPRHHFMDSGFIQFAYRDQAFPIGAGQTISQPYTVAFQTQLLEVKKHEKVLEVGTGSGYQAAILIELGAKVYTIERHRELYLKAQGLLPQMGYKPHFFYGDGYEGLTSYAPFDKILITAAAPMLPPRLKEQLKVGGRMVLPLGESSTQVMTLVEKTGDNKYHTSKHGLFTFVPLLKGRVNEK
jgi:protein-L-isoaspartate(D-aspartate) O-methyltransferase